MVARGPRPLAPSLVHWGCREVADLADEVTQKRGFAIFGRRAPACATHIFFFLRKYRIQIFLRGQRRGSYRMSSGLHHADQRLVQAVFQKKHIPSRWRTDQETDGPGSREDNCRARLECDRET